MFILRQVQEQLQNLASWERFFKGCSQVNHPSPGATAPSWHLAGMLRRKEACDDKEFVSVFQFQSCFKASVRFQNPSFNTYN